MNHLLLKCFLEIRELIDLNLVNFSPGIDTELPAAVNSSKKGRHKYSYSTSSPWKALFMSHRSVEMNWRTRPIKEPKVLIGHDDHVITCLQFSGELKTRKINF